MLYIFKIIFRVVSILFQISWAGTTGKSHKVRWNERLAVWCSLQRLLPNEDAAVVCRDLLHAWLGKAVSIQSKGLVLMEKHIEKILKDLIMICHDSQEYVSLE